MAVERNVVSVVACFFGYAFGTTTEEAREHVGAEQSNHPRPQP